MKEAVSQDGANNFGGSGGVNGNGDIAVHEIGGKINEMINIDRYRET